MKTAAEIYPGKIILGIDALGGQVAVRGWTQKTSQNAVELARRYENCGIQAIVYTDIQRDGMETGVNVEATSALATAVAIPVIASGGAGKLEHFKEVFITGKADAALAASIFHYKEIPILDLKNWLTQNGIPVRF